MKNYFLVLLLVIGTSAFSQQPVDRINAKAIALQGDAFLKDLSAKAKNAEVIGLGEASHGTHEFFSEKGRIINYLISHEGFRLIGIETSYSMIDRINTYLQTGKGDLKQLMSGLRLYNTQEMFDVLQSVKAYNDKQPANKKVTLYGFDTDYVPQDVQSLASYCLDYINNNPQQFTKADAGKNALKSITATGFEHVYDLPDSDIAALTDLYNEAKAKPAPELAKFKKSITLIYQNTLLSNPLARDEFMAQNLIEFQQGSKAKTIVWGHNVHLAKDTTMAQCRGMGYYVRKNYGEKYYAIGFDTYKGKVTMLAGDDYEQRDFSSDKASLTAVLATAKLSAYWLPLSETEPQLTSTPDAYITNLFANWMVNRALPIRPGIDFDALIFIKETTASTPLK